MTSLDEKCWIRDEAWAKPELIDLWDEAINEMLVFHHGTIVQDDYGSLIPLKSEIGIGTYLKLGISLEDSFSNVPLVGAVRMCHGKIDDTARVWSHKRARCSRRNKQYSWVVYQVIMPSCWGKPSLKLARQLFIA